MTSAVMSLTAIAISQQSNGKMLSNELLDDSVLTPDNI